jgi:phosphate transport system substrate-binding protein
MSTFLNNSKNSGSWAARIALISSAILFCSGAAHAQIAGAGATSVRELMAAWNTQFGAASGGVSYDAVGSSQGVAKASEQTVDFGVTDVPQTSASLRKAGLRQLPLVGSAVAVVVNLPELDGTTIKLNGNILADIYQGSITTWNHSQIAGANPGVALPNKPIVPIWRADGSGQSYALTGYLSRNNTKWKRSLSSTSTLSLNVGKGVRGGQAMIEAVKSTPGAVGYDVVGSVKKAGLSIAQLSNAAGKSIAPTDANIKAALASAAWTNDNNAADLDGSEGAATYPITTITYALVPAAPKAVRKSALTFLQTAVAQGDDQARKAGFEPLPTAGKNLATELR